MTGVFLNLYSTPFFLFLMPILCYTPFYQFEEKNMLKRSISFALAFLLSSGAFAATGAGHAQAELTNPLTVTSPIDVNWGTIAIDPSAGPQTISMSTGGIVSCPSSYVCPATATRGLISITGAPNTPIDLSLSGQIAILSDGNGNTLTFDPFMNNASDFK
jgi:hypothetical protein